jgi:hypothetical protein
MNLVRPTYMTDALLTSTDVPETDYAVYVAWTTYATGTTIVVIATHKVYESLQDANTGNYPPDNTGGTTPWWLEIGATNAWKMFDTQVGTQTSQADGIVVETAPGRINSLALLNISAASVAITLTDPTDGVVYSETVSTVSASGINDWYAYFFEPIVRDSELVKLDIPAYSAATLKVEFIEVGETVACGMMVVGNKKLLGMTQWQPEISILDYSRKETDAFGNPTLIVRKSARLLNADIVLPTSYVNEVRKTLTDYRATPAVWAGDPDFQSTIIYGFYRSFSLVLSGPSTSDCNIEIEGLI